MIAPADVIANRAWLRREQPFPHLVARDVFTAEFYEALAAQMRDLLARGLSDTPAPDRFSRNIAGYDSYGVGFDLTIGGPAALFHSCGWRDLMCGLFDVGSTPYVFAGSHHHAVGSASGFIHNDFNSVWFRRGVPDRIHVPANDVCTYTRGIGPLPAAEKIEVVRGVVVLFFLLNDGWRPGDGGEIGLFTARTDSVDAPAALCPPINNSLIVFECTPRSFHAFIGNRRRPRTSIIMWVHRPLSEAIERFGADQLEQWAR